MDAINKDNYEAWLLDYAEGALHPSERLAVEAFLEKHPELRDELDAFETVHLPPADEASSADWSGLRQPDVEDLRSDMELRDAFFVKCMDGEGTPAEREMLEELLMEQHFQHAYDQWKRTVLTSGSEAVISKDSLYQWGLDLPLSPSTFDDYLIGLCEGLLDEGQKVALHQFAEKDPERKRQWALATHCRLQAPTGVFYPDKGKLRKEQKRIFPLWFLRAAAVALLLGAAISIWMISDTATEAPLARITEPASTAQPAATDSSEGSPVRALPQHSNDPNEPSDAPLEDWEVFEPDAVHIAQSTAENANGDEKKPGQGAIDRPLTAQLQRMRKRGISELDVRSPQKPSLVHRVALENTSYALTETPPDQPAEQAANNLGVNFSSIPQLATKSLARQLELGDPDRDELALAIARRLTEKAGEALNTEVSKQTNTDGDQLTYTLRIGGLRVTHSRSR